MSLNNIEPTYEVVVNHESQYSIWPNFKDVPQGWHMVGMRGTKEACLNYIRKVWTDMNALNQTTHKAL